MRFLFWALLLFALAVTVSLVAQVNDGLVMFVIPPYRVDLSFNAFLLMLIGIFPVIYGLLRLLAISVSLPERVKAYREARRRQILLRDTVAGIVALFSGRFRKAEKAAERALESHPEPELALANSLVAARAAHFARNYGARDQHLARLSWESGGDSQLATLMTKAHLAHEARDYLSALDAVTQARVISPNLTSAIQLELSIRQRLEQPEKVLQLLDLITKSEALSPGVIFRIRQQAYLQQLQQLHLDARQWQHWWQKIPVELKPDSTLAAAAARKFIEFAEHGLAAEIVVHALENEWDTRLINLFGDPALHGGNVRKAIQHAEEWLQNRPRDAALLLALGRLCRAEQLWGKAQSYTEASLAIQPSALAHLELAELAELSERHEDALPHIRQALALTLEESRHA